VFNKIIGAGQGGCRIASEFQKVFETKTIYMNFASIDFSKFKGVGKKLIIETGGTGRDPFLGQEFAKEYKYDIENFLSDNIEIEEEICLCLGGGGGSGCGMSETIINKLFKLKSNIFIIYTLPEKKEKLPAKPNALKILNILIEKYVSVGKASILLIDNEYSANKYNSDGFRFKGINKAIPKSFRKFFNITNLSDKHNYIDFSEGYNSLDKNELKKVMFYSKGFTDIRIVSLDDSALKFDDNKIKKELRSSSLFMGSFDINTSKIALVVITIPNKFQGNKKINSFVEKLFKIISAMTKAPYVFNSSYYDKRVTKIRINIMLGGLTKSKALKSLINQAIKDKSILDNKDNIEKLDLTGL
jgi:cell division GTPase FtsZ